MNEKEKQELLGEALLKKALGYDTCEVVEEFAADDGQVVLLKKKVTQKSVPPDMAAIKMLIGEDVKKDLTSMTDEELFKERERLMKELKESENLTENIKEE